MCSYDGSGSASLRTSYSSTSYERARTASRAASAIAACSSVHSLIASKVRTLRTVRVPARRSRFPDCLRRPQIWPFSAQTGRSSRISNFSPSTDLILPLTVQIPTVHAIGSPSLNAAFDASMASGLELAPRLNGLNLPLILFVISGSVPGVPTVCPIRVLAPVKRGSRVVPTPIRPPAIAYGSSVVSQNRVFARTRRGIASSPFQMPGRISTTSSGRNTPRRIVPPMTPPRISDSPATH